MKKILKTLYALIIAIIFIYNVEAASGSITVSSSSKTVVVGSTFTVTVKLSCSEELGSWQFGIQYDSSRISLQSGDSMVVDVGDGSLKTKTYTYKFKAIKSGSASIKVNSPSMTGWNEGTIFTPSTSQANINIKTQAEIEASYSKNNNLKSLTVAGYTITPNFKSDVLEYQLEVAETEEQIKISAIAEDGNSSVSGIGTVNVSSGKNKINIIVTAQNGSTKTYTLVVDVKDINPVVVKVNNKEYTLVKKAELLTSSQGFVSTTVRINDMDIPALANSLANITLVGLKDTDGIIEMYQYNETKKEYVKFEEIKTNSITIVPLKNSMEVKNFSKKLVKIQDVEYDGYVNKLDDECILVYGINLENGEKDYYRYDNELGTFSKYNAKVIDSLLDKNNDLILYIIALASTNVIFLILVILLSTKHSKLKKKVLEIVDKKEQK